MMLKSISLVALIGVTYWLGTIQPNSQHRDVSFPKFRLVSKTRQHLPLVVRAFEKLGFVEDRNFDIDGAMSDVLNYDISWGFNYPNYDMYSTFLPHTRVNHIRGNSGFTRKGSLFSTFAAGVEGFGAQVFDFVPEHFLIPEDSVAFQSRLANQTTSHPVNGTDPDYGTRWIVKSRNHGKIKLITGENFKNEIGPSEKQKGMMVSKYVEPLLVDKFKWDIGLYLFVSSVEPLRIYVHQNSLVRMCLEEYPVHGINASTSHKSYVVKNYSPPWEKPSLEKHYEGSFPDLDSQNTFNTIAMCKHIDSLNLPNWTCAKWWDAMKSASVKLILQNLPTLRKFNRQTTGFRGTQFELYRADFNTDANGKPWLVEVNMSPNLLPKYYKSGNDAAMKRDVVESVLNMVSPHAQGDFPNPFMPTEEGFLGNGCPKGIVESPVSRLQSFDNVRCVLHANAQRKSVYEACDLCFPAYILEEVSKSVFEYSRRGAFELAYPPLQYFDDGLPTRLGREDFDKLWHESLSKLRHRHANSKVDQAVSAVFRHKSSTMGNFVEEMMSPYLGGTCATRGHCNGKGSCVALQCVCDTNYEGTNCERYIGEPTTVPTCLAIARLAVIVFVGLGLLGQISRIKKPFHVLPEKANSKTVLKSC